MTEGRGSAPQESTRESCTNGHGRTSSQPSFRSPTHVWSAPSRPRRRGPSATCLRTSSGSRPISTRSGFRPPMTRPVGPGPTARLPAAAGVRSPTSRQSGIGRPRPSKRDCEPSDTRWAATSSPISTRTTKMFRGALGEPAETDDVTVRVALDHYLGFMNQMLGDAEWGTLEVDAAGESAQLGAAGEHRATCAPRRSSCCARCPEGVRHARSAHSRGKATSMLFFVGCRRDCPVDTATGSRPHRVMPASALIGLVEPVRFVDVVLIETGRHPDVESEHSPQRRRQRRNRARAGPSDEVEGLPHVRSGSS